MIFLIEEERTFEEGHEEGFYEGIAQAKEQIKKEENEKKNEDSGLKLKKIIVAQTFSPKIYADELFKENKFFYDNYFRFWRYDSNEGMWKPDAEEFIRSKVRNELLGDVDQKQRLVSEIVSYIRDIMWNDKPIGELPLNLIPFKNCIYDIEKDDILSFSPEYFVTSKIPVNLNGNNETCPLIDKFFEDLMGAEQKSILYDLYAYCLYRAMPFQKFFILWGPGENGKSKYLALLRKFLGAENVSSQDLKTILTDKFSQGRLWNKMANIYADIDYDMIKKTAQLKILTGEDLAHCEKKFKEPFDFYNYAKLIFSTNEIPQTLDKTNAFHRRVYILKFLNKFEGDKRDPKIIEKISTDAELSGLAWICLKKLKFFIERNYEFELNPSTEEQTKTYEELSNPLIKFIQETYAKDTNSFIFKWKFEEKFFAWLKDHGFRVWSQKELGIKMKEEGFETVQENAGKDEHGNFKYWRAWGGIRLKGVSDY